MLHQLVDDACARTVAHRVPHREDLEAAVAEWYPQLGLPAPRVILWAQSPGEASALLDVMAVSTSTIRAHPDQIGSISAFEAVSRLRGPVPSRAAAEVIELAAARQEAFAPTHRAHAVAARGVAKQISRELGRGAFAEFERIAFERMGIARSHIFSVIGDIHGWHSTSSGAERRGWRSPFPPGWMDPEILDACETLGVRLEKSWTAWSLIVRSTFACWFLKDCAVICERASAVRLDPQGRLHSETGPAITWADGSHLHAWHGTPVPSTLIEGPWPSRSVMHTRNAELRRCAIERIGWKTFIDDMQLRPIGRPVDDPGNPGFELELFEVPRGILGPGSARILLCTNASVERDGTRRRFGLRVPPLISDALSAAAWTFGVSPALYRTLTAAS